jgi:type I restriction enzyme S subunit
MKWETFRLGEVMDVKHGFAFKGEFFADSGEHILLTPGNCYESGGLRLRGDKEKYYSGEFPDEYLLQEGDMLVVMTDLITTAPILGGSFLIPESNRFLHNQRLGLVQVTDEKRIDKRFLYYLLNTHSYRGQVRGSASGATVRHTSPGRIKGCKVRVPQDVTYQGKIGVMISAYDESIENNRRRIELLERAARLLYQEWFVRLRFPGHEHTRTTKGVPQGWQQKILEDICSDIRENVLPEELEPDTPYIGLEHIPRRSISLTEWGKAETVTSSKHRFKTGDILFGKIRPYFHKVGIAFTDGVASSDAIVIRPNSDSLRSLVLMTVSSDKFVAEASQTMREGSKMPRADWKLLKKFPVAQPPQGLLENFSETITSVTDQLRNLCFQNQKLRAARDLLLPRLMSGEITV